MTTPTEIQAKRDRVLDILKSAPSVLVAFSGGVDSSLLLALAKEALGSRVLGVTVRSALVPEIDRQDAATIAARIGCEHVYLDLDQLADAALRANPPDRCYHCKHLIMEALQKLAAERGLTMVAEGSNVDDRGDYRPGSRAVREMGVRSPLAEAGLTKPEIRVLSRELALPSAEKPAMACLASRIPYGESLTPERLARVDRAESFLRGLGFAQVRVRDHGASARIEVPDAEIPRLADPDLRARVVAELRRTGYTYVALDLEGYRTGTMNRTLGPRD